MCLDAFPWADMYNLKNPKPEWVAPDGGPALRNWADELEARQIEWEQNAPGLTALIEQLERAVLDAWIAANS